MGLISSIQENAIRKITSVDQSGANPSKFFRVAMPFGWTQDVTPPQDYQRMVQEYRSWVYVCSKKNASAVAESVLRLYLKKTPANKGRKSILITKSVSRKTFDRFQTIPSIKKILSNADEVEEVLEHPFLDLMSNVNPFRNRFETWEETQLFLELVGNSYWYIVKNKLGVPAQIWILPAQYVRIVPSEKTFIAGYVFYKGLERIPFDINEIVHFKFTNPNSMHYGVAPLWAIYPAHQFQVTTRVFENTMLGNMGRPEGLLSFEEEMDEAEYERVRKDFEDKYGGPSKAGRIMVVGGSKMKYDPLSMTPKDMSYQGGLKITREEILAAYDVPMSMITMESSNRAVSEVGDYQYFNIAVEPRLRRLEEKLNEAVIPLYDENLFVSYDNTVPEDREFRLRERESNLRTFYSSINIERDTDKDDHVPWGDAPWAPMGLLPLGSEPIIPGGPEGTSGSLDFGSTPPKPGEGMPPGTSSTSGTSGTDGTSGKRFTLRRTK